MEKSLKYWTANDFSTDCNIQMISKQAEVFLKCDEYKIDLEFNLLQESFVKKMESKTTH